MGNADAELPLGLLIENLPSALIVVDQLSVIRLCNRIARTILGCEIELDACISKYIAPLQTLLDGRHSRESSMGDHGITPACNPALELGFSISSAETEDGTFYLLIFRDISSALRLRQERDRLLRIATLGKAMPTILHELKNPLAAITTSLELMIEDMTEDGLGDGELASTAFAVLSEARRMELTIDGVGVVKHALRCARYVAVDKVCRGSFALMEGKARNTGVILSSDIPSLPLLPFVPAVVRAVVYNLVSNSISACGKGGQVHFRVRLDLSTMQFELSVKDTGRGMSAADLAKCTELFYSTKRAGSGIGLALCQRVAEEAGGGLSIESELGVGTTITLNVPAEELSSETASS